MLDEENTGLIACSKYHRPLPPALRFSNKIRLHYISSVDIPFLKISM